MSPGKKLVLSCLTALFSFLASCTNELPVKNQVIVHLLSDPEMMTPCNTTDDVSWDISTYLFQKLIDVDLKNPPALVPILAESRPSIEKTADHKMLFTFKIRPEAKWDNGSPVTAKDVEFTVKTIKNPLVNNPSTKPYFTFISDFIFYPDDDKKFTIVSNELYFLAEGAFSDLPILPEHLYDPKGLMKDFTVKMTFEKSDSLKANARIKEFADDFNSEKRMRDPAFIGGSGPYKFTDWKTNERIILTKKDNWWGNQVQNKNCFFEAYPDNLIFQIIKDQTSALVSLKAGNLDVMGKIKVKDFIEFPKSEKFVANFNVYSLMEYSYVHLGLNTKSPLLTDKLTRQALAHIIDVDDIIKTIKYGEAERIIGPIHPSKKNAYNSHIQPYDHNLEKAKELLEKAGWKNTNGDETLDKIINGKRTEFVLDFIVNTNDERKAIALMCKEQAKKANIGMNILVFDWAVFLNKCSNHEFDITMGKWSTGPNPDDLTQIYYSESAAGGSNYYNFSNAEADALIDSIRTEIDEEKRNKMYLRIQEILHDEVPIIYLYAPSQHLAIHKKFKNAYPSVIRPGYWLPGFQLSSSSAE